MKRSSSRYSFVIASSSFWISGDSFGIDLIFCFGIKFVVGEVNEAMIFLSFGLFRIVVLKKVETLKCCKYFAMKYEWGMIVKFVPQNQRVSTA